MFLIATRKRVISHINLTSFQKLHTPHLPPIEAFYSTVKGEHVLESERLSVKHLMANVMSFQDALKSVNASSMPPSKEENYRLLQDLWEKEAMQTLMDLLKYYNNVDLAPFCEVVEKMRVMYPSMGICSPKDLISAPGIVRKLLFD